MALTKVTGQVIKNTTDVTVGVLTVTNTLAVGGTVSIGGTLTYEDVTNIDSVGLITARNGIVVGSGITLSKDGDVFSTGITTVGTGLSMADNVPATFGDSGDLKISHNGTDSLLQDFGTGNLKLSSNGAAIILEKSDAEPMVRAYTDGAVELFHDNSKKIETTSGGVTVTGALSASGAISGTTGTFTGDVDIADKIVHTGDTNTAIRFPSADTVSVETGGSESFRVDSERKVLIGTTSELLSQNDKLQIADTSANAGIIVHRASNDNSPPYFHFHKTRGTSVGDATIVQSGDELGRIRWNGTNGSGLSFAAEIRATVDGSPGASNDMPGRLQLYTTPDGSGTPTERLRITSAGRTLIQEGTFSERTLGVSAKLQVEGTDAPTSSISVTRNSNDTNPAYLMFGKSRGTATGANTILQTGDSIGGLFFYAGDGTDLYSESAFIRAGIATGRTQAIPTVGSNSTPGFLEFATTLDGDANARKHVEIDGDGIFKMMTGNTENDNNSGFDTNQNAIGFYKIKVNDETNSADILMPKPGCLVFIQTYSDYPAYPQPQGSVAYVDSGASKNASVFLDPYNKLAVKTTLDPTVSNCDNDKYTLMPGSAYQTLRITNRLDNSNYIFCITMI